MAEDGGDHGGLGEFWGVSEAAVGGVVVSHVFTDGGLEWGGAGQAGIGGEFGGGEDAGQFAGEEVGIAADFTFFIGPGAVDSFEDIEEPGLAVLGGGREVGAAKERFSFWGHEHVERPAATQPHGLQRAHIDPIQIRSFFAVEFDGDEIFVEEGGDFIIHERFAFHDVAPMAGGVADAEENRFIFLFRSIEGFLTPWVPIDWVMCVLQQVRGFFLSEPVGGAGWGIGGEGATDRHEQQ